MGHTYKSLSSDKLLAEIGTYDWRNLLIRVWDNDANAVLLTPAETRKMITLLKRTLRACEKVATKEGFELQ